VERAVVIAFANYGRFFLDGFQKGDTPWLFAASVEVKWRQAPDFVQNAEKLRQEEQQSCKRHRVRIQACPKM
jgi:hypothetical protein